jgi:large subunit ribosomal protein L17
MRHRKHNHLLGVKTAHRTSLLANLSCSLIENGRIKTTLAKARALRPTIEKVITLAKKANIATDAAQKVHFRRLAISRLRSKQAVKKLFDELVEQFVNRNGGYTRIYKLAMPRLGDAADMAIIEFVEDTPKKKAKKKKASSKKSVKEAKKTPEPEADNPEPEETESDAEVTEEISEETVADAANEETESVVEATDAEGSEEGADEGEPEASAEAEPEVAPEPESEEDSDSKDEEQKSKD